MLKKIIVKTNENEESDKVNLFVCNHKTNGKSFNLSLHVITNYFSIRKNRVTKEPSGKGYERTRKIAVLAKKKAVEKSKISNYKFQTRFKTKPTPVIQILTKTQLKRPTFHHMKVSQKIKTRRKNHTHCQNAKSNLIWVTKALTGKPVNYALIVRITVSKTLFAKNV